MLQAAAQQLVAGREQQHAITGTCNIGTCSAALITAKRQNTAYLGCYHSHGPQHLLPLPASCCALSASSSSALQLSRGCAS